MKNRVCSGCGILLQNRDSSAPGFVPIEKTGAGLLCRRCYRLLHYGIFDGKDTGADLSELVKNIAGRAGLTLLVADFFDLEGSLALDWPSLLTKRIILLVNKSDLIPPRTSPAEVAAWAGALWQKRFPAHGLESVKTVSARGRGFNLVGGINPRFFSAPAGRKAIVAGATNTGKSSLLRRLLTVRARVTPAEKGKKERPAAPTVSAYPGTTQGVTGWFWKKAGIELFDTPGLVPGTRMPDHLCPACAGKLLPNRELTVKLWELPPGGTVLFGNLAACKNLSSSPRTVAFYAGDRLTLHRTSGSKAEALLAQAPDWLRTNCMDCSGRGGRLREQVVQIEPGQEYYISGLGWLGVKREPAALCLLVPEKVENGLRPAMLG